MNQSLSLSLSLLSTTPVNPLRSLSLTPSKRHRHRRSFHVTSSSSSSSNDQPKPSDQQQPHICRGRKELTGIQPFVDKLSPPARLVSTAVIVAGAVAAGYGLGLRIGNSRYAAIGGAIFLGAAGGAMGYALNSCVPDVAAVNLHNYVTGCDDPGVVKRDDIENIARKHGVSKQDPAFNLELANLYCEFVASVLPPGSQDLSGDEVEKIISFKDALGIDDPEAAEMHMEIGRRILRQRLETGNRDADIEQRRAFQKLIYVSTLVFGEASSFLLHWKCVFKVTNSQVEIAIRDNARRVYASKLKSIGRDINKQQLISLREAQVNYKLADELAADLFREHSRKLVEDNITVSFTLQKSRTNAVEVVEELDKILAYNDLLVSFKDHQDAESFARGIGPVSLVGGEYDDDCKIEDLKILYRTHVTDSLSGGRVEEQKLAALNQLRNIFGLGKKEAEAITLQVTSKAYLKRLSQAVCSGDLEAASSKATFLQNICDELHFDPLEAIEIHEGIYRQKLKLCVVYGELSDEHADLLLNLRVMLCMPQDVVEAAHTDICGSLFEKVVKHAVASGVDGYDPETKKSVIKAAHGLRLTREAAMSTVSKAVRSVFLSYIKRAKAAENLTKVAKELKKLIAFNTLVATELVADIKGKSTDTKSEEPINEENEQSDEDEQWESLETLRKTRADKDANNLSKPSQTVITLKDDLLLKDRIDPYKTYLLYCLTGEVKKIPFGVQITTKRDDSEYHLLNELGQILGLTKKEIVNIHRGLAEQAFRQQAELLLADNQLTKARVEQLNELQVQVGLPSEYAQKIIKSITTTKMAAAIETTVSQGKLNIEQIRELNEAKANLDSMISERLRENIFKKTVDEIFSSGTGEFDEEEVYGKIPLDLNINVEKSKAVVQGLAQNRLSNSLIQAVALLRQKNSRGVVSSLNDLLACAKAVRSEALSWDVREELVDLFVIYTKSNASPEKVTHLQHLLGISDSAAAALQDMGEPLLAIGSEEEEFVF